MLATARQLLSRAAANPGVLRASTSTTVQQQIQDEPVERIYNKIVLELRGHEPAVLDSYGVFLKQACKHLSLEHTPIQRYPYVRWVQYALRCKFVFKKYKLHYETRTHIRTMELHRLTGSTASTALEYFERQLPEGVAMRVEYHERLPIPETLQLTIGSGERVQKGAKGTPV